MPLTNWTVQFDSSTPVNNWATDIFDEDLEPNEIPDSTPGVIFGGTGEYGPFSSRMYSGNPTITFTPASGSPASLTLTPTTLLNSTDWYTGYRPGSIIITFTSAPTAGGTITVKDSGASTIGSATITAALEYTIALTFTSFDLGDTVIADTGYTAAWTLAGINFESVTADFWINFVGTTEIVATGGVCP